jgi:hypothetical protein
MSFVDCASESARISRKNESESINLIMSTDFVNKYNIILLAINWHKNQK